MPMTDARRRRHARDAADALTRIAAQIGDGPALHQMRQAGSGPTAMRFDRPVVAHSGTSDPTARAALAGDRTDRQLTHFDRLLAQVTTASREMEILLLGYGPPREANDADRLALMRENTRPEPGCESCARTEAAKGRPRWEPCDSRRQGPTTVGGRLPEPMLLCSWCADRVSLWDRLPTVKELEAHHEGRRVAWPKDVPRPA